MEKLFIQNRKGQKVVVVFEENSEHKGLVFVMHGLSGFKEEPHLQVFRDAFIEKGFTTVMFDTTNTFGESDGNYEDATITNYYEDLEDVITWAKSQSWYQEPFVLAGHSLGGISTALYAERHPDEVMALAPISSVISGKLSGESREAKEPGSIRKWQETGWEIETSKSRPGVVKRLPWSHMQDRLKYDLLPDADKLTMPVLLIAGTEDTSTPLKHQQMLYEVLPGPKEIHAIEGAGHTFPDPKYLAQIKELFLNWIATWQK